MPEPASYGEAKAQAAQLLAAGRLNDPAEHFPYKLAAARQVCEENPPAGRLGPDDDSLRVEDFISENIIYATADYVDAQARLLAGEIGRDEYEAAKAALVAARAEHRRYRDGAPLVPVLGGMRYRRFNEEG